MKKTSLFLSLISSLYFAIFLQASPSIDEIRTALDVSQELEITLISGSNTTIEIIEAAEAINGSALRLTVPGDEEFELHFKEVYAPSEIAFRILHETEFNASMQLYLDSSREGYIGDRPREQWRSITREVDKYNHPSSLDASIRLETSRITDGPDRVFLIDDLKVSFGATLEILESEFASYEIHPVKERYRTGEPIRIHATFTDPRLRISDWNTGSSIEEANEDSNTITLRLVESVSINPYIEYVLATPIGQLRVNPSNVGEIRNSGEGSETRIELIDSSQFSLDRDFGKRGIIAFQVSKLSSSAEASFAYEGLGDSPIEYSRLCDDGVNRIFFKSSGDIVLSDFSFTPAQPVAVEIKGAGSVLGVPEGLYAETGDEVSLRAVPDEGWKFGGWTGAIVASEPELTFIPVEPTHLVASFCRELDSVPGLPTASAFDPATWSIETDDQGSSIILQDALNRDDEYEIGWKFEGPGLLSLELDAYRYHLDFVFDGIATDDSYITTKPLYQLQIPPGHHDFRLRVRGNTISDLSSGLEIARKLQWKPGYAVTLESAGGGSITSNLGPESRTLPGEFVEVTAVPDEGFEFSHWTGSLGKIDGDGSLQLHPNSPLELKAFFKKTIESDSWVEIQVGPGTWEELGDSWTPPSDLELGQISSLSGTWTGPCILRIHQPESGLDQTLYLDGEIVEQDPNSSEQWVEIDGGEHTLTVEVTPSIDTTYSTSPILVEKFYTLSLPASGGNVAVIADREFNGYDGIARAGSQIAFEAKAAPQYRFVKWRGDLEGKPSAETITVNASIESEAVFQIDFPKVCNIDWQITGGAFSIPYGNDLHISDWDDPTIPMSLKANITGPGAIVVLPLYQTTFDVTINGEIVSPEGDLYNPFYIIPEGENEVEITIPYPEFDGETDEIGKYDLRFQKMAFESGWTVSTPHDIGYVNRTPSKNVFQTNETLTLAAGDHSIFNSFAGWRPPFENKGSTFSLKVDKHTVIEPIFEALTSLWGQEWDYHGTAPAANKRILPDDTYAEHFIYDIREEQAGETVSTHTIVVGPGYLKNSYWVVNPSAQSENSIEPVFSIDGNPVPADHLGGAVFVDEGDHDVDWKIAIPQTLKSSLKVLLAAPVLDNTFYLKSRFNIEGQVSISPKQQSYLYGEEVTVTLPETNTRGSSFAGWYDYETDELLSTSASYTFPVTKDLNLQAYYDDFPERIAGLSILEEGNGRNWARIDLPSESGSNTTNYTTKTSSLIITPEISGTVSFSANTIGDGANLHIWKSSDGKSIDVLSGTTIATNYSVYLEASETLHLDVTMEPDRYNDSAYVWNVSFDSNWSPTIIIPVAGELVFEPRLEAASLGDQITVKPAAITAWPWRGWLDENRDLVSTEPITFVFGTDKPLRPLFSNTIETPWGTAITIPAGAWNVNNTSTNPTLYSQNPINSQLPQSCILEIDGPKVLSWSRNYQTPYGTLSMSLRGEGRIEPVTSQMSSEGWVQIPAGKQHLTITLEPESGAKASIGDFESVSGYKIRNNYGYQQRLTAFPQKTVYNEGDTVSLRVTSYAGRVFAGWQPPYENQANGFEYTFGDGPIPVPTFNIPTIPFQALGESWNGENIQIEWGRRSGYTGVQNLHMGDYPRLSRVDADAPSVVRTTLHGPKVIRIENASRYSKATVRIDSEAKNLFRGYETEVFQIPAGEHCLEISTTEIFQNMFDKDLQIVEGYALSVHSIGGVVDIIPQKAAYGLGETVRLVPSGNDQFTELEWAGLPENVKADPTGSVSLTIEKELDLNARFWRKTMLSGLEFSHAGNYPWTGFDQKRYTHRGFANAESDLLRFTSASAGKLRLSLKAEAESRYAYMPWYQIDIEDWVAENGEFERNQTWDTELFFNRSDTQATITIGDFSAYADGFEGQMVLQNISFEPMATDAPYLIWWNAFDRSKGGGEIWRDLQADIDFDGFSNYEEFLLGTDPWSADALLKLRNDPDNIGSLLLDVRQSQAQSFDSYKILFSDSPLGPWIDASNIFLSEQEDQNGLKSYHFLSPLHLDYFFRIQHTTTTPDLDELLNKQ